MTRIVAVVEFDEQDLPEELERIPLETWGAGELGLLLQDGDGGIAMAYGIHEIEEEDGA